MQRELAEEICSDMNSLVESTVFEIELMNSGRPCLNLNSRIDWEKFPEFAEKLIHFLGAKVQKKTDSFDVRIWELLIQGEIIRLVFDDFPVMVSLESTNEASDEILMGVKSRLEDEAE